MIRTSNWQNRANFIYSGLFLIAVWELFSFFSNEIPNPATVWRAIEAYYKGDLLKDTLNSLKRVLIGFILGAFAGILLAFIGGWFVKKTEKFIANIVDILRPIPPIAWIPLAIIWFGLGDMPAYFLVFIGAFFPVYSSTYSGIKNVERIHLDAALSLGASSRLIFTDIIFPVTLNSIMTGLKISIGISWMIVIVAEMIGAQNGLGYMIQTSRIVLKTDNVIACMIIIAIIGYLLTLIIDKLKGFLLPWSKKYVG